MKRKRQQKADFPKKKRKLGKGKRPPENATRVSFKSQSISVPGQLEQSTGPTTHRKLGLQELLKQLSHPKPSVCRDACNGLRELFINSTPLLSENLSRLINELTAPLLSHDQSVHHALYLLLKYVYSHIHEQILSPYFERMLAGLTCAITHLDQNIRHSGLKIIDLVSTWYPVLLQPHINSLLPYYLPLLSSRGSKNIISSSSNKLNLSESKLLVLKQILNFLTLVSTPPTSINYKPRPPIINIKEETVLITSDSKIDLYEYLSASPLQVKLFSPDIILRCRFRDKIAQETCPVNFIDQLLHSLLEYWIELSPLLTVECSSNKKKNTKIIEQMVESVDVLVQLICLLVEVKGQAEVRGQVSDSDCDLIVTHFLPHFPLPQHYGTVNVRLAYLLILTQYSSLESVFEYLSKKINTFSKLTQCIDILTKILKRLSSFNGKGLEAFYSSVVKLFISVKVTSLAKQNMLLFIEQLLDNYIKLNTKFSTLFRDAFLYPFLCSLPDILLLKRPIDIDIISRVLKILLTSLSLNIKTVEQSIVAKFHQIYGSNGFIYSIPQSLLSPTIQLIGHFSHLSSSDLSLLSSLITTNQFLPVHIMTSLIYIVHNKLLFLSNDGSNPSVVALHISFLFSLLIGYPEKCLRQMSPVKYLIQKGQMKFVEPLMSNMANDKEELAQVVIGCLVNCHVSEKELFHVLEPSLIQLLRSLTVIPIDMIYRLVCLLSQFSIHVSSSLSQVLCPLLIICLNNNGQDHMEHVLIKKCSLLIRKNILSIDSTLKSDVMNQI